VEPAQLQTRALPLAEEARVAFTSPTGLKGSIPEEQFATIDHPVTAVKDFGVGEFL